MLTFITIVCCFSFYPHRNVIIHCMYECVCVWLLVLKIMFESHHFLCYKNTVEPSTTEV